MLDCDVVHTAMGMFSGCQRTEDGLYVTTHCMYPSFEPVGVYVVGHGGGFIVHDKGEAARGSWMRGIESRGFKRIAKSSAALFGCEVNGVQITCEALSSDWLWSAITSVANASADAARAAMGKVRVVKEASLITKTKSILDAAKWKPETKLEYPFPGKSGKTHMFDLAVFSGGQTALIDAVVAHPNSIAAKYLALSDAEMQPGLFKYALYEGELEQHEKALLSNVADLINFKSLSGTNGKFLLQ